MKNAHKPWNIHSAIFPHWMYITWDLASTQSILLISSSEIFSKDILMKKEWIFVFILNRDKERPDEEWENERFTTIDFTSLIWEMPLTKSATCFQSGYSLVELGADLQVPCEVLRNCSGFFALRRSETRSSSILFALWFSLRKCHWVFRFYYSSYRFCSVFGCLTRFCFPFHFGWWTFLCLSTGDFVSDWENN